MEKKKRINLIVIIAAIVIVLAVAGVLLFNVFGGGQEVNLKKKLTDMGSKFYTEFYYPQISNGKENAQVSEFLVNYKLTGIKINLDNLEKYNNGEFKDIIEKDFKSKGKECSKSGTQAVIYPTEPYGPKDYKAEAVLDCGFETK